MRILFVFPNLGTTPWLPLGIAYLSAVAKRAGHQTSLLDTTFGCREEEEMLTVASSFSPDLVAISTMSFHYDFASKIAQVLKEQLKVPICMGGVHPTLCPDEVIANDYVDMICVGEGDEAFEELLDAMESGRDISSIANIWAKTTSGKIVRNEIRPLIEDLDLLPFPDRDLFDRRHLVMDFPGVPIITARGCPYSCTYCVNQAYKDIYKGKGKPVRFRAIECVLEEMREVRRKYNPPSFFIDDETILARKNDLRTFCGLYKKEIGLPFRCMARVDQADEETLRMLKEAGCVSVHFGIESGNEHIRRDILKRSISDETVIKAFRTAKEIGLKTHSFNMIGLPNETLADVKKTLELNRRCQPNSLQVTILYPFIGTEIRKVYEEKGWLKKDAKITSVYGQCAISLPDLSSKDLLLLQKLFPIWYYFPHAKLFHWLIKFVNTKIPGRIGRSLAYRLDRFLDGFIKRSRIYDDFTGLPNCV